jgi:predicted Zn-dependent protease
LEYKIVNRTLVLALCLVILVAGWFAYSGFSTAPASASSPTSLTPRVADSKVYFVPLGTFRSEDLSPLAQYYHDKFKLDITILPSVPIDSATLDTTRSQLMAEQLVLSLRNSVPDHANDPNAILIGFTSEDMYPTSQGWQFAFGWRTGSAHAAVVSTSRMTLHYIGEPSDLHLPETRLRKMVTKDIGILYYGLSQSNNPSSVLYNGILGIQELDQVGEDF